MTTYDSNLLKLSRRQLLTLSASASALALASAAPRVFAAENAANSGSFTAPSATNPIRINFNENALGMSPKGQQAARDAVVKGNRYAKAEITELSKKLASLCGITTSQLLLTAGSSEGIRCAIEAYAGENNVQLVIPELTYGDGEHFALISGLKITKVPMKENWTFDIDGLKKAVADHSGFSIVYFVNPNNPTGTITPADLIEPWINSKPDNTLFIVDEAYAEFVNDDRFRSVQPLINSGADNIILLKTFSKIYAMAGMRVGYAVAHERVIKRISGYVAGEKLNFPGVCAALVSLDDRDFIAYSKKSTDTARMIFTDALSELGLDYLPSHGNFVFHKVNGDLADFQKRMADAHILVGRAFPPATGWCRTSLGTPEEMAFVAQTLKQLRQKGWV